MKNKKVILSILGAMIITTFLPWYSAQSISIGGWGTLMGFVSLLFSLITLILVLMSKKVAFIPAILASISSLISLGLNAAIWGPSDFVKQINRMIKPEKWSEYLSFGGSVFLILSIVLIVLLIKSRKKGTTN
jgi:hypothetical protein